jgi:hypothetical protein
MPMSQKELKGFLSTRWEVPSQSGDRVEILGDPQQDWRVTMIDTGMWRNIGERLRAVREHIAGEEMLLANYSNGLADFPRGGPWRLRDELDSIMFKRFENEPRLVDPDDGYERQKQNNPNRQSASAHCQMAIARSPVCHRTCESKSWAAKTGVGGFSRSSAPAGAAGETLTTTG